MQHFVQPDQPVFISETKGEFMTPESGSSHNRFRISRIVLSALASAIFSSQVHAAGFALIENGASGQGNAFAGAAAVGSDASTVWFNPAGMMRLGDDQLLVAGNFISPKASFSNNGSTLADGATPISGSNDDGGRNALVPNLFWVMSINRKMKFGLGVNAPFGLETEYDDTWVGRYHAVRSDLKTLNINPSIAYQVNDALSIGGGLNVMLADVTFTNAVDFGSLLGMPQAADGFAHLNATNYGGLSDFAYGFNLGLLYNVSDNTRIGLAYRSKVTIDVSGSADFKVPAAAAPVLSSGAFKSSAINASVDLPASASLSLAHEMNKLTLLADITWTGWSSFDELRIKYSNTAQPDSVTTENWDNALRYSIGADWRYSEKITLRAGIAYDQTPVPDAKHRTARVPGNNRTWLSLGGGYVFSKAISVDVGYSHLFVSSTDINNTFESSQPALAATLKGSYDASIDILSAQLVWKY